MGYTEAADGALTFDDGADPQVDLQGVADLAISRGVMPPGTRDERLALTSQQSRIGWLYVETDTGSIYERVSGGWRVIAEDTGWVEVVPTGTGFKPYASGIRFRRINGVVHFNVSAYFDSNGSSWGAGDWAVAAIPVGFRPARTFSFTSAYFDVPKELQFTADGRVAVARAGSGGITVAGSYPLG